MNTNSVSSWFLYPSARAQNTLISPILLLIHTLSGPHGVIQLLQFAYGITHYQHLIII